MSGLRDALEKRLASLPTVTFDNGYWVQALPKADLLDLLALHPAEPTPDRQPSDAAVEAAARAYGDAVQVDAFGDVGHDQISDAMEIALEAA